MDAYEATIPHLANWSVALIRLDNSPLAMSFHLETVPCP